MTDPVLATTLAAAFSPCGQYRWWLERLWQPAAPRLLFIGLNPSRADGQRNDPTLRRLLGFAQRWGYGSLEVLNLFARVSPSPAVLRRGTRACIVALPPRNPREGTTCVYTTIPSPLRAPPRLAGRCHGAAGRPPALGV